MVGNLGNFNLVACTLVPDREKALFVIGSCGCCVVVVVKRILGDRYGSFPRPHLPFLLCTFFLTQCLVSLWVVHRNIVAVEYLFVQGYRRRKASCLLPSNQIQLLCNDSATRSATKMRGDHNQPNRFSPEFMSHVLSQIFPYYMDYSYIQK